MEKIILVAKSSNNVIGVEGTLPWKLPADERYYHQMVKGHWALIGRKAFEAEPVVPPVAGFYLVTRDPDYRAGSHRVVNSISAALALAEQEGRQQLFILGGGGIYRQTLPLADRLLVTEIYAEFEGDTFFPPIDPEIWVETWREPHEADGENPYAFAFTEWRRRNPGSAVQEASLDHP